jgi:transposase
VAELVRVRRLTDQEGQRLQQIVRRGSTSSVRYRRAMMLLASAGGNRVPVTAQLVQADEDTVRDVIHRFNEIRLSCLDPRWAGGRPRQLSNDDEDFVVQTATTRPVELSQPFTRWSIRELAAYLHKVHGRVIRIGREALRRLLARRGITFQRTKTWKKSPDPERDTKLDRIEEVLHRFPDRVFAFDEFGPLGIRPTAGSAWAGQRRPDRLPATYHRTHGVRYFLGCYSVGDDTAQRIQTPQAEARELEDDILQLVRQQAPELFALQGVGPITAAQILVSWSHPGRFRSEAAFASFAGGFRFLPHPG